MSGDRAGQVLQTIYDKDTKSIKVSLTDGEININSNTERAQYPRAAVEINGQLKYMAIDYHGLIAPMVVKDERSR